MGASSFTPVVNAYRLYFDGTESGSTPRAAENTAIPVTVNSNAQVHVRIRVDETGGKSGASTDDYDLQYAKNGGAFAAITTSSSNVQCDTASSLTDAAATTNRATNGITDPGSGSFVASEQCETDAQVTNFQLTASNFTEIVWAVKLIAADLADGDTITFRVTLNGGSPGMTNAVTPTITVNKPVFTNATPWAGSSSKLFLQSGQFSSTLKTSLASVQSATGIEWDGTNTPWSANGTAKLYLQSGQFSATLKTSRAVANSPQGISWDGANSPWANSSTQKLILQSGQFSATVKTSLSVSGVDASPTDVSWDGTNTPWIGATDDKLYLQSGHFSATLKTSVSVTTVDATPAGISWDGTNTPWSGTTDDKLYLQSGQFSATLKTSLTTAYIALNPGGIGTNNVSGRLTPPETITMDKWFNPGAVRQPVWNVSAY
jgi:hypothetical protein